jgi:hypothetical protein
MEELTACLQDQRQAGKVDHNRIHTGYRPILFAWSSDMLPSRLKFRKALQSKHTVRHTFEFDAHRADSHDDQF